MTLNKREKFRKKKKLHILGNRGEIFKVLFNFTLGSNTVKQLNDSRSSRIASSRI